MIYRIAPCVRWWVIGLGLWLIAITLPLAFSPAESLRAAAVSPLSVTASIRPGARGIAIARSFLGMSIEWGLTDRLFTRKFGRQATMIRLLKMLGRRNGPPVLRIGGNSQDEAVYNLPRRHGLPKFVHINIPPRSLQRLAEVCRATGCKLIIGLNLAVNRPALAVKLVKACRRIIGNTHILAYEIGNEPDFFHRFGGIWNRNSLKLYVRRWRRYDRAIRGYLPTPAAVEGPAFGGGWTGQIPRFIRIAHRDISLVGLHHYALGAPIKNPGSPLFASIANLLKNSSATAFVRFVGPIMSSARKYHLPVRYTEMNSAWGGGKRGVSDTFASSFWCLSTLFQIAHAGITGVAIHLSEGMDQFGGYYGPVYFHHDTPLRVRPMFYGMLLFSRMLGRHSTLLPVEIKAHGEDLSGLSMWAVRRANGRLNIMAINKNLHRTMHVNLSLPGLAAMQRYRLTGPAINAMYGLKLAGQTFDGGRNGRLRGGLRVRTVKFHVHAVLVLRPMSITVYECRGQWR